MANAAKMNKTLLRLLDNPHTVREYAPKKGLKSPPAAKDLKDVYKVEDVENFIKYITSNGDKICRNESVACSTTDVRSGLASGINKEIDRLKTAKTVDDKKIDELDRIADLLAQTVESGFELNIGAGLGSRESVKSQDILNGLGSGASDSWTPASNTAWGGEALGKGLKLVGGGAKEIARPARGLSLSLFGNFDVTQTSVKRDDYGRTTEEFLQGSLVGGFRFMKDIAMGKHGIFRGGLAAAVGGHYRSDNAFNNDQIAPGYTAQDKFGGWNVRLDFTARAEWTFWNSAFAALDGGVAKIFQTQPNATVGEGVNTKTVNIDESGVNLKPIAHFILGYRF